jgi:putative hydrolase of the HAD superfamily
MIKTIFFDLYYTLIRYDPPREQQQLDALEEYGFKTDHKTICQALFLADLFFYQENALSPIFKRPQHEQTALHEEYESIVMKEAGFDAAEETALAIAKKLHQADRKYVLYEDVLPTFDILRERGMTLGLITNAEQNQAPLEELGLYEQLDYLITSPEEGMGKPAPHIFWAALRKAGVSASEAIHVGDQYDIDVVGARGVGIKAVLLDRNHILQEFDDCPRINSLSEIVNHL